MPHAMPGLLLRYAPVPADVQHALSRQPGVDLEQLARNPHLDDALFRQLYTARAPIAIAKALLWRSTLTREQALHAARIERRPGVLTVLVNAPHGTWALDQVAATTGIDGLSPTSAMMLMRRCGDATADAVAGCLTLPDASLWLMSRWSAVTPDAAVQAMTAAAGHKSRRRWTPMELAAVAHERGALAPAILTGCAAGWNSHAHLVTRAVDMHGSEVADRHGSAEAFADAILDVVDLVDDDYQRRRALQAFFDRADVPASVRTRAGRLLGADPNASALPFDLELDWRRDPVSAEQAAVLTAALTANDDAKDRRKTLAWQAVSALRNPSLDPDAAAPLAAALGRYAVRDTFGGVAKSVADLVRRPRDKHVLVPGRPWAPGGRTVASAKTVRKSLGDMSTPLDSYAAPEHIRREPVAHVDRWGIASAGELVCRLAGDDVTTWSTVLELAADWRGTVGELLDAVASLTAQAA